MTTPIQNDKPGYIIGIDIGGTKMCAVLMDGQTVIEDYRLATPKDDLNHFLIMIKALTQPLFERAIKDQRPVRAIGLGIAGTIDYQKNKITNSPNITFIEHIKIIDKIRAKLAVDLPIILDNDANCFTRAEARLGAGRHFDNVYGITIGTGIGGGHYLNGNVYLGAHGGAGEPGELLVDLENKITLEAAYQKLTQNNPRILAQEAYDGDPLAEQIFQQLGSYLGLIFANIVNIVDPGIIIIGGGTAGSSDLFLSTARQVMAEHISSPAAKKIKIIKARLGELSGAIGAALLFD